MKTLCILTIFLFCVAVNTQQLPRQRPFAVCDFYSSTHGSKDGSGTRGDPWDVVTGWNKQLGTGTTLCVSVDGPVNGK